MNEHDKSVSKFLSYVLRHHPEEIGLELDAEGWANVEELLSKAAWHHKQITAGQLRHIVATNDKKRFVFSEDEQRIRASQGHSITVDLQLQPIAPPEFLYHGTAERNVGSILAAGIIKGERNHVHLSTDHQTAIQVGSRYGKPVVLTVQAGAMQREGYIFFCSENGVWLTETVPAAFLSRD